MPGEPAEGDRLTVVVHLPVPLGFVVDLLALLAREFPDQPVDYSGPSWRIDVGPS